MFLNRASISFISLTIMFGLGAKAWPKTRPASLNVGIGADIGSGHAFQKSPKSERGKRDVPFTSRVDGFWKWFEKEAPKIEAAIASGKMRRHVKAIAKQVQAVVPDMMWELGPGRDPGNLALVITGEGNIHLQLLARVWVQRAPKEFKGWEIHAARQATPEPELDEGEVDDRELEMYGAKFAYTDFRVVMQMDDEYQGADVIVYHPGFMGMEDEYRLTVASLRLADALGEIKTGLWIASLDTDSDGAPEGALTVNQMLKRLHKAADKFSWTSELDFSFTEVYEPKSAGAGDVPRTDVVKGYTCLPGFFDVYYEQKGTPEDPLAGSGAMYVYLAVPMEAISDDWSLGSLCDVMEALGDHSFVTGGAVAENRWYVDLLVLDRKRALKDIQQWLDSRPDVTKAQVLPLLGGPTWAGKK